MQSRSNSTFIYRKCIRVDKVHVEKDPLGLPKAKIDGSIPDSYIGDVTLPAVQTSRGS